MEVLRGADGLLYRITSTACTVIQETDADQAETVDEVFETPSVDDHGAARAYITG